METRRRSPQVRQPLAPGLPVRSEVLAGDLGEHLPARELDSAIREFSSSIDLTSASSCLWASMAVACDAAIIWPMGIWA